LSRSRRSEVHGPGLCVRAHWLPSSDVCAVHAGVEPCSTPCVNRSRQRAHTRRPSVERAQQSQVLIRRPCRGIAVVLDSLGSDHGSPLGRGAWSTAVRSSSRVSTTANRCARRYFPSRRIVDPASWMLRLCYHFPEGLRHPMLLYGVKRHSTC
jgi:hypothetical protein